MMAMMNIYAKPGTKVSVTNESIKRGLDPDKEQAQKYLKADKTYTVQYIIRHAFSSEVVLEEFPGVRFNTVHFVPFKRTRKRANVA